MANCTDHGSKLNLILVYQKILRSDHVVQNIEILYFMPVWNFSHSINFKRNYMRRVRIQSLSRPWATTHPRA